ncbi:hypothetical protein RYX36_007835, partial [Vicia faba]
MRRCQSESEEALRVSLEQMRATQQLMQEYMLSQKNQTYSSMDQNQSLIEYNRVVGSIGSEHNEALTLSGTPFQGTWARSVAEDAYADYNSNVEGDRFSCITFCYVLHRCKSLDICCQESFYIMCQNITRTKTVSGAMQ